MTLSYDRRLTLLAIAAGLPPIGAFLALLWMGSYSWLVGASAATLVVGLWIGLVVLLRERIVRPLQTVSNLRRF